jgi:hypothetical protein
MDARWFDSLRLSTPVQHLGFLLIVRRWRLEQDWRVTLAAAMLSTDGFCGTAELADLRIWWPQPRLASTSDDRVMLRPGSR